MKINNEQFFAARRDERLETIGIFQRTEHNGTETNTKTYLRLWIKVQEKYTKTEHSAHLDTETEINVENYSGYSAIGARQIESIAFTAFVRIHQCHIRTFLNAIDKDSNVLFRVVAFNMNQFLENQGVVSHQVYGVIDGKAYFLSNYTGPDNHGSPIKASPVGTLSITYLKAA